MEAIQWTCKGVRDNLRPQRSRLNYVGQPGFSHGFQVVLDGRFLAIDLRRLLAKLPSTATVALWEPPQLLSSAFAPQHLQHLQQNPPRPLNEHEQHDNTPFQPPQTPIYHDYWTSTRSTVM